MAASDNPTLRMTPVSVPERIEILDVLRGAALFGIIASNMRAFNSPQAAYVDHSLMWTSAADRIAQGFVDLLITGKFITLFSFLFGIGFAMQMERAGARGVSPRSFYLRRLGVLLLLGVVHSLLLWWGDILAPYALMGFALFGFRKRSQKTVLLWAAACYAWPLVLSCAVLIAVTAGVSIPIPPKATAEELQRISQVFSSGSYAQMFQERLKEMVFSLMGLVFYYPRILGIFLFGLWCWRAGIVRSLAGRRSLLRRCLGWGLAVGFTGNAVVVAITEIYHPDPMRPSVLGFVLLVVSSIGMPTLSMFYASALALLLRYTAWQSRLRPFAAVGRTALSNYLLQTVICTTLFNSWGFGLYGKVGPLAGLLPTVLIYGVQVPLSVWWIGRHAFGPLERVWRTLTYGRLGPMARATTEAA